MTDANDTTTEYILVDDGGMQIEWDNTSSVIRKGDDEDKDLDYETECIVDDWLERLTEDAKCQPDETHEFTGYAYFIRYDGRGRLRCG